MTTRPTFSATAPTAEAEEIVSLFGPFFGACAPQEQLEKLIASTVLRHHFKDLAEVCQTRWWDYRRMSPGHAFMLFIDINAKARETYARLKTRHRAGGRNFRGLRHDGKTKFEARYIFQHDRRHVTGLWNAMQTADSFGIPYNQFLHLAYRHSIDNNWQYLPQPSQMYSEGVGAAVVNRYVEMTTERLILPKHPIYRLENYAGLKIQDDYHAWLIDMLKRIEEPADRLSTVLYDQPHLPMALAEQHFDSMVLRDARLAAA